MLYSDNQKADMLETLVQYYDYNKTKYGEGDVLTTGEIALMFGKTGGVMQHNMPFNMIVLQNLGMILSI
ncbi:MAG: hypothetical protein K2M78_11455 [Lachnospiraceae bacterium]|nr:hypothetical protein [Lachnospiraceae bacterium]